MEKAARGNIMHLDEPLNGPDVACQVSQSGVRERKPKGRVDGANNYDNETVVVLRTMKEAG